MTSMSLCGARMLRGAGDASHVSHALALSPPGASMRPRLLRRTGPQEEERQTWSQRARECELSPLLISGCFGFSLATCIGTTDQARFSSLAVGARIKRVSYLRYDGVWVTFRTSLRGPCLSRCSSLARHGCLVAGTGQDGLWCLRRCCGRPCAGGKLTRTPSDAAVRLSGLAIRALASCACQSCQAPQPLQ